MTTRDRLQVGATLVLCTALASTTSAQPGHPAPADHGQAAESATECPEFIRGATLSLSNIDRGVQFEVVAGQPGYVAPLRQTVGEISTFIEDHQPSVTAQAGTTTAQAGTLPIPPVNIDVTNIDGGTRVTLRAKKGANVAELREHAKQVEELWQSSTCINGTAISLGPRI